MALTIIVPIKEQQKEWYVLWKPIIDRCQECSNADKIDLLQVLSNDIGSFTWKNLKHLTEYALNNSQNASAIFQRVSSKIKKDENNQNEIIQEMLSEVRAIPCLVMFGFKNLVYERADSIDFKGTIDSVDKNIEVTYISGPNFKTQTKSEKLSNPGRPSIYELGSKKLISRLKSTYQNKEKQFDNYNSKQDESILFIVTNLLECDQFWLMDQPYDGKHPIQAFVDSCPIPTIVLAPGLNPYISNELANILLTFDKYKYIELAYGMDAHEEEKKHTEIQRRLEEKFWEGYNSNSQY